MTAGPDPTLLGILYSALAEPIGLVLQVTRNERGNVCIRLVPMPRTAVLPDCKSELARLTTEIW